LSLDQRSAKVGYIFALNLAQGLHQGLGWVSGQLQDRVLSWPTIHERQDPRDVVAPEFGISLKQPFNLDFAARACGERRKKGQEQSYPMAHEPEGLRIGNAFERCECGPRGLAKIVVDLQHCQADLINLLISRSAL
jgi:hypothetical protein